MEARLRAASVPHSPVNDVPQVLADEQVQSLEQIVPMEHPAVPDYAVVNLPMTFDGQYPLDQPTPPPALGADSHAVLQDLGVPQERIDALVRAGVVGAAPSSPEPSTPSIPVIQEQRA